MCFSLNSLTRLATGFGLESALPPGIEDAKRIHPYKLSILDSLYWVPRFPEVVVQKVAFLNTYLMGIKH